MPWSRCKPAFTACTCTAMHASNEREYTQKCADVLTKERGGQADILPKCTVKNPITSSHVGLCIAALLFRKLLTLLMISLSPKTRKNYNNELLISRLESMDAPTPHRAHNIWLTTERRSPHLNYIHILRKRFSEISLPEHTFSHL